MDSKITLRIILLFSSVTGSLSTISIEFCSGKSIKDHFDNTSKDYNLKLDGSGSNMALIPSETGYLSCSCLITPVTEVLDKLHVRLTYVSRSVTTTCNKNVQVWQNGGELQHVFGCASDSIVIQHDDLEEGIRFTVNWFGNAGKDADMYYLYIAPEPGTVLTAQCYAPTLSSSTSASNVTESSTMSSTTSSRAFKTAESDDTLIVVGVMVGLGLFFLLFISCMLCYIARRKARRDVTEKSNPPEQSRPQHHNFVGRTLTNIYDKMKANRPLPRLPASVRKMAPWKMRNQNGSGVYDSIKSNKDNPKYTLDKQESQTYDCSYLEPTAITTISETVMNRNLDAYEKNMHIKAGTPQSESAMKNVNIRVEQYTESDDSTYIHPKTESERNNALGDGVDSLGAHKNETAKTYMNLQEANLIATNVRDQKFVDAKKRDAKIQLDGSGYMMMGLSANKNGGQDDVAECKEEMKESNRDILVGTDSAGYMSLNSCVNITPKLLLTQNDSIFPELVKFTPHDIDTDEKCMSKLDDIVRNEDNRKEGINNVKNVKTKRYVRDKNSKYSDIKDSL